MIVLFRALVEYSSIMEGKCGPSSSNGGISNNRLLLLLLRRLQGLDFVQNMHASVLMGDAVKALAMEADTLNQLTTKMGALRSRLRFVFPRATTFVHKSSW